MRNDRLLCSANDVEHAVDVSLEILVGIGLKDHNKPEVL